MLPKTHLYIADFTLDQIKGRGIYLNEKFFKIGNVIPDFSPYHKFIRHYQNNSLEYVERTVSEIIGSTDINEISFKSGVICHYLADYFCYPHFNNMTFNSKDIAKHIQYETELNDYVEEFITNKGKVDEYRFKDIHQIITSNTTAYNNSRDFNEDLNTALSIVNNFIINSSTWGKPILV